jgi:hypothetical protein
MVDDDITSLFSDVNLKNNLFGGVEGGSLTVKYFGAT